MGDRNPTEICWPRFYRRRDSGHSSTGAIGLAIKWLRAALTKTATFANAMRLAGQITLTGLCGGANFWRTGTRRPASTEALTW